jgi:hypothetical protein
MSALGEPGVSSKIRLSGNQEFIRGWFIGWPEGGESRILEEDVLGL